jgi:hypothetical protein
LEKLKARVGTERMRAPLNVQEGAFTSLWVFADMRKKTTEVLSEAAPFLREGAPLTEDMNARLSKTLLATVLMDKMAELRDAVMSDPTVAKLELFQMTRAEVVRLLSKGYFSKSVGRVRKEYFAIEPVLVTCAECCSVPFMPSESAMREQAGKAEFLMDEL